MSRRNLFIGEQACDDSNAAAKDSFDNCGFALGRMLISKRCSAFGRPRQRLFSADSIAAPSKIVVRVGSSTDLDFAVTDPDEGQAISSVIPSGVPFASVIPIGNGSYILRLTPGAADGGSYPLTLTATDNLGLSATLNIVLRVNRPPTANAQSVTTDEDQAKAIVLTGSDGDGDTLRYTVLTPPSHGSLTGTVPNLTYTPALNYNGSDSFTFKVSDGLADSSPATVSLTIIPLYRITDLGTLGGNLSVAYHINDKAQVVGEARLANGIQHAYVWQNGVMTDLGTLSNFTSQSLAQWINNSGQIVGSSLQSSTTSHAFVWQNSVMTDLGALQSFPNSSATSISDAGLIAGNALAGSFLNGHAVTWQNGSITDQGALGYILFVNDSGQMTGNALNSSGQQRAFLLQGNAKTETGTLPGYAHSFSRGINVFNHIVGASYA